MAIMVPTKPYTSNQAEKKVFQLMEEYFPDENTVIYHNKEVSGQEFDFCVLLPGMAVLIIEVKGWKQTGALKIRDEVEKVVYHQPNGAVQEYEYPKNQSRKYRFELLKKIKQEFNYNPKTFDMACYPNISRDYFTKSRLDLASGGEEWTIFEEDLSSREAFIKKINQAFELADKNFGGNTLTAEKIKVIRRLFESEEYIEMTTAKDGSYEEGKVETSGRKAYSILTYIENLQEIEKIFEEYKKGTKLYLIASGPHVYDRIIDYFQKTLRELNLFYSKGELNLKKIDKCFTVEESFKSHNTNTYSAFNLLVTYPKCSLGELNEMENFHINDGSEENLDRYDHLLSWLDQNSGFNYSQFKIEHADPDKHIMVEAGAGTGKTLSMISRLTYLQYVNNYLPEEFAEKAAMITFTNEAADNMKSRLRLCFQNYYMLTRDSFWFSFIEQIDNMRVSTIHSLVKALLQKYAAYLGYGREITVASGEYERREFIEEALEEYFQEKLKKDPEFPARINIPTYELKYLLLELLNKLYNKNMSILNTELDFGTPHKSEMGGIFHEMVKIVLPKAEEKYQAKLAEESRLHLNDMIYRLWNLLRTKQIDLTDINFDYLFVDEFQDTDNIQIDLIKELQLKIRFTLFVVGDIKQCIYRFRGAEEAAFDELVDKPLPENWQWFSINKNYRTDTGLLKISEKFFARWGKFQNLTYSPDKDKLEGEVSLNKGRRVENYFRIVNLSSPLSKEVGRSIVREISLRRKEIQAKIEKGALLKEEERTIAVLVRNNWEARQVYNYCRNAADYGASSNIFIQVDTGGNLYSSDPAIDLYKLVLALKYPLKPKYLFNLVTTPYFNEQIDLIYLYTKSEQEKLEYLIDKFDNYFRTCLANKGFAGEEQTSWREWVDKLKQEPVLKVLRTMAEVLRPWDFYASSYSGLETEVNKARTYYKRNLELVFEKLTKSHNVDYLTINRLETDLKIKITTGQSEKTREDIFTEDHGEVKIICITVHKAKGREFDTVIVPFGYAQIDKERESKGAEIICDDNKIGYRIYYSDAETAGNPVVMQSSHYSSAVEKEEKMREETRILYVAMTRALRNFTFFWYTAFQRPKSWQGLLSIKQGGKG